jgi:hypothetical protein
VSSTTQFSLPHRTPIVGSSSVRSVTCMHALLLALTLMDMGIRGKGELSHVQEQVGRPSLALPPPILSRKHREHHDPILAP